MDANQTRFHLLLGQSDWAPTAVRRDNHIFPIPRSDLEWDDMRKELRLRSELFHFKASPRDNPPTQNDRRGAATDSFYNWFWIGGSREEIRVLSSGEAAPAHFWSAVDVIPPSTLSGAVFQPVVPRVIPPARAFKGLAVTEDHYLVVGTVKPDGLIIFDLLGGGPPRTICWPVEFTPFDMVPRPGGGVWILDREHARFWGLDRTLRVIACDQPETTLSQPYDDVFQPPDGPRRIRPACTFPEGISLANPSPVQATDPVAIEALADGSVLILDAPKGVPARVLRYKFSRLVGESALDFPAFDFAFAAGRLYIASAEGNQTFAFDLGDLTGPLALTEVDEYFPMRRFGGKALVAANGRIFYDFGERWLMLVSQPHPRYVTEATLQTRVGPEGAARLGFDGREPQCVWHRVMLDGCLPPNTDIEVSSRAADVEDDLPLAAWNAEPPLYRRSKGSELPFAPVPDSTDRGTFELLLQKACGRFLQLQLRLIGDGRRTPQLHALRIYYPRFSYLQHYLPAVYRENADSASFLERFLANLEGTNTAIEDRIAAVQMLFDVRSAPADALEWLASWFGVALDPAWNQVRRRLFLAHAMEFFQWRGTVRGLKMALRLAFDDYADGHIFDPPGAECRCAERYRIVEKFLTRQTPAVELGDPSEVASGPLLAPAGGRWEPSHGAAALNARYKAATKNDTFTFTPLATADAEAARIAFAQRELGFIPSDPTDEITAWSNYIQSQGATPVALPESEPADAALARMWRAYQIVSDPQPYGRQRRMWQQFLVRRYVSLFALNQAHATAWKTFDAVAYPASLPANIPKLQDWFEFEAHVLPTLAAAHRFTVLLPVTATTATSDEDRRNRLALANRLIELEKPSHTVFDVRFFWALFRVGEARLGSDSVLSLGGRDPALLLSPTVLGQSYLAESVVATGPPPSLSGRIVMGRDRLKRRNPNLQ